MISKENLFIFLNDPKLIENGELKLNNKRAVLNKIYVRMRQVQKKNVFKTLERVPLNNP